MNPDKISKFIYELRKEKGLSQYQLADMIPISRQAVSKWERGKTIPDSSTLIRLSEIFDVSINELLKGERLENNSIKELESTTLSIVDEHNKEKEETKKL
jgi:transcriptional regulator with XRE-family HTH domain